MTKSERLKTFAWTFGGAVLAVRPEITKGTIWDELSSPWFVFIALSGGLYGLKAYWATPPENIGKPNIEDVLPEASDPTIENRDRPTP
jgi:hypothetical protein